MILRGSPPRDHRQSAPRPARLRLRGGWRGASPRSTRSGWRRLLPRWTGARRPRVRRVARHAARQPGRRAHPTWHELDILQLGQLERVRGRDAEIAAASAAASPQQVCIRILLCPSNFRSVGLVELGAFHPADVDHQAAVDGRPPFDAVAVKLIPPEPGLLVAGVCRSDNVTDQLNGGGSRCITPGGRYRLRATSGARRSAMSGSRKRPPRRPTQSGRGDPRVRLVVTSEVIGITRFRVQHATVENEHLGEVQAADEDQTRHDQVGHQGGAR